MRTLGSEVAGRAGRYTLRVDQDEFADGLRDRQVVVEAPSVAIVVPVFEDQTTVLVRQWRYAWGRTSWEVPAGTLEPDEDPEPGALRELEEEAGLRAGRLTSLGRLRPLAALTVVQHLFLARDLTRVERRPEVYERDMIVRELPLADALDAALAGEIEHSGSCAAIARAARALRLI